MCDFCMHGAKLFPLSLSTPPKLLFSTSNQWQGETQEFCPNAKVVLVGCKLDMRTDLATLRELSKQRLIPVTHEQVRSPSPPTEFQPRPHTHACFFFFFWFLIFALTSDPNL